MRQYVDNKKYINKILFDFDLESVLTTVHEAFKKLDVSSIELIQDEEDDVQYLRYRVMYENLMMEAQIF